MLVPQPSLIYMMILLISNVYCSLCSYDCSLKNMHRWEEGIMEQSENMEYRGFSYDWYSYFVEIPWNIQEGLPWCNSIRSESLLLLLYHFLQISVCFVFFKSFFGKFSNIKLTSTHVIWTFILIIMYIQIIVVCYTLVAF